MPNVSVIVPVYKVEKYLPRCTDSILNQTYKDFELILIDDGSPDRCGEICDEYAEKDSRIRVVHKENGGVSAARNTGLDLAIGEYIAFCDSDDYWEKEYLETLLQAAEIGNRDIVFSCFQSISDTGEIRLYHYPSAVHKFSSWEDKQRYLHTILLLGKEGWAACTKLFRASVIQKNNIRFCTTCGNFAEDLAFVAQCVMKSESIEVLENCLYNYILRDGSMMHRSEKLVRIDEVNEVSRHIGNSYSAEEMGAEYQKFLAITHFFVMYNQYAKVIWHGDPKDMPRILSNIRNKEWFIQNTRSIFGAYSLLKDYYGTTHAQQIINFSWYCLHQNFILYRITRGIHARIHKIK